LHRAHALESENALGVKADKKGPDGSWRWFIKSANSANPATGGEDGGHENTTPRYLRIPQAASYLGLAPKTLYRLTEERRIPHIRKGRTLFFDRVALDRWMQAGTVNPLSVWENHG